VIIFNAMEDTIHFADMLRERGIKWDWVNATLESPKRIEEHEDGTRHFLLQIPEFGNRWLRVIVNVAVFPEKRVTAFFDRRLRRKK